MAPRFHRKDDSVETAVRRIATQEIGKAVAVIDSHALSPAQKVHRVRKLMKSLRALLRLVRPSLARFDKENCAFRDIARTLSACRDHKVLLDTFDLITRRPGGEPLPHNFQAVRERLDQTGEGREDPAPLLAAARRKLVAAGARARHWSLSAKGWQALGPGLAATYGGARKAMRRSFAAHDAEASHEWRKGVTYHSAQAQLLHAMRPDLLKTEIRDLTRLAALLGRRHDIDLFLSALAQAPSSFGDVVTVTQLAGLARLRLHRLDRQATHLGTKLFAEKPARLAKHWGGWWKEWHAGAGHKTAAHKTAAHRHRAAGEAG